MKPKNEMSSTPTATNQNNVLDTQNAHSESEAPGILSRPHIRSNAADIAQRRLRIASDHRSRFVSALTLVSLGVDSDG
ncbi:MAG: hypothetical protein KDI79_15310 [Anaerolineae bacterium]|nr:hypothetical protein [Anaerolineae bacterium]